KFIAHRSLSVLLQCHLFWTIMLCLTTLADHARMAYKLYRMSVDGKVRGDEVNSEELSIIKVPNRGKHQNDTNNAAGCLVCMSLHIVNVFYLQGITMPFFFLRQFR
ncbi:hypothetical protein PENTCL1PPCAC_12858, partial [Pristionchus entomophagus]